MLSAPVGLGLHAWAGILDRALDNFGLANATTALVYGSLGLVLLTNQPRNRLVWFLVAVGVCAGATPGVVNAVAEITADRQGVARTDIDLSGWPWPASGLIGYVDSLWVVGFFGLPTLGLLLAPDGRLPSPRWRPVAISALLVIVAWIPTVAPSWRSADPEPAGRWGEIVQAVAFPVFVVTVLLSLASIVLRYRRGDASVRRRLRWVVLGAVVAVVAMLAVVVAPPMAVLFYPALGVGLALATWRHQLFDVDVVISRTILYGLLALFIGAVYVGAVFGLGSLLGRQAGADQRLSLLATVVVAFAFQPVRVRLERVANRLVFGRRATPYEVLADLSARLGRAESTEGLLDRMVARLAAGTGAKRVVLWRAEGLGFEPLATWPDDGDRSPDERRNGQGFPEPGAEVALIERSGATLGAFTVMVGRGVELNPTERRLLDDLTGSAGLVLDKARLDDDLADRVDALSRSRRRLVDAQDDERQRLERQLQAGIREELTAFETELADTATWARADGDGPDPVWAQLEALTAEVATAGGEIQALARGIYPPVLEVGGLTAAVEGLAAGQPTPVEVRSDLRSRLAPEVELAAYFCIAEALTNAAKYADADRIIVTIDEVGRELRFEVVDDGCGFDRSAIGDGSGLLGLSDRLATVDGRLGIRSRPGVGTAISGSIPIGAVAGVESMT